MALIDMDKLIACIKSYVIDGQGDYLDGVADAVHCVTYAPTVDAVEVVRCEECKESDGIIRKDGGIFCCPCLGIFMTDNNFCSYGERKEGGENG